MERKFVFIVGLPRSGTKLLRTLLNNHFKVFIPTVESHFIPRFILKFGFPPEPNKAKEFIREIKSTTYYFNLISRNRPLNENRLKEKIREQNLESILEYLFLEWPFGDSKTTDEIIIYGDKTPVYIKKLDLLTSYFPEAYFIHIIRDPRDQALSSLKTWGKPLLHIANTWVSSLDNLNATLKTQRPLHYYELLYENLIENTEEEIKGLCQYLGIEFQKKMTAINIDFEAHGSAKNKKHILKGNSQKYLNALSKEKIKRIEEITYDHLKNYNYPIHFAQSKKKLERIHLLFLKIQSGINSCSFHIKEKGFYDGIKYFVRLSKENK